VSSDLNQAALNAIIDGFHYWMLIRSSESASSPKRSADVRQPISH